MGPGLFLHNHTNEPVYVSAAYWSLSPSSNALHSQGWVRVNPRQTKQLLRGSQLGFYRHMTTAATMPLARAVRNMEAIGR